MTVDLVHPRCAGIDISKRDAKVCVRVASAGRAKATSTVTTWGSVTNQVLALREHLVAEQVTLVVMEATSDYWKPFYYLLEDGPFEVMLVNARHVRNLPGRKSDVSDAAWLAQLGAHGLVRGSFVPPEPIRQLRDLTRTRTAIVRERAREIQRLEKLLEDALLTELREEVGCLVALPPARVATVAPRDRASRRPARPRETDRAPARRAPFDCGPLPAVPACRRRRRGDRPGLCLPARAAGMRPAGEHPALLRDGPASLLPVLVGGRGPVERGHPRRGTRFLSLDPARRQAGAPGSRRAVGGGASIQA